MGGGCALWTSAAAAVDAPPTQPDQVIRPPSRCWVALLQRQHDAKLDVVVPARDLRMTAGDLHIEGIGEPTITLEGVTPTRGVFRPTATCDGGIAEKLGIPCSICA